VADSDRRASEQQIAEQLGGELLRIHEEAYGRSAGAVSVKLVDDCVVVFLDELELQRSEEFLIDHGQAETVLHTRGMFQEAIEATFRAAVERATGRRVTSFASLTKLDPNYCVEVFRLAAR
jgi:uncharacterized protein YbcI